MCGIFAALNCDKAAERIFVGLHLLQPRAQEYAGIGTTDGRNLFVCKGKGIVQQAISLDGLNSLHGRAGVGHIRYSTCNDDDTKDNAQPIRGVSLDTEFLLAHNGNITVSPDLSRELLNDGPFATSMDTEIIARLFARSKQVDLFERVHEAVRSLDGSYSLVILLANDTLIGVRDPFGNRPLWAGRKGKAFFFSSEPIALQNLRVDTYWEMSPGQIIVVSKTGEQQIAYFDEQRLSNAPISHPLGQCFFELVYFAFGPELFGYNISDLRHALGAQNAREHPVPEGSTIISVPDSANLHAEGFAVESGESIDRYALFRSHYVARTFINGTPELRALGALRKYFVDPLRTEGRSLVVVDDSIVRNTTMPAISDLLRGAGGAREVHFRSATPRITNICEYGIDIPTPDELVANRMTIPEMAESAKLTSLGYTSVEGLKTVLQKPDNFCLACVGGRDPFKEFKRSCGSCRSGGGS